MDKTNLNQIIGIALIMAILFIWSKNKMPTEVELAEMQRVQDSIKVAMEQETATLELENIAAQTNSIPLDLPDSVRNERLVGSHGIFAPAASGAEEMITVENDLATFVFTNKGGKIKEVILKDYHKSRLDSNRVVQTSVLKLLEDEKNKFEYTLPVAGLVNGVKTSSLYFTPTVTGKDVVFRASAGNGKYFEQKYVIKDGTYNIDYTIKLVGLDNQVGTDKVRLNWVNYLDKIEENTGYEKNYSSAYFYDIEEDMDYCSCTSDAEEKPEERMKWISHSNQFFNSSLIAKEGSFKNVVLSTEMMDEDDDDLKKLTTSLDVPMESGAFAMNLYVGPNEYDRLAATGVDLQDIIPFGSSIFGTINRWIVRPLFGFLSQFISSKGLVIMLLTLIVKLVLFPFTYKMVHSQQKMAALKPRLAKMKEKFKDDQQAQQMEQMKMYREYGVNPMGGCLPVVAQMPIWFALFRFFPASIEFRQAPFLWAHDLSSFDVFTWLPFDVPFYGSHLSLFTLLWAGTTVLYTVYNSKQMDMSSMGGGQNAKMMMYMQYMMPLMFLFFFNNYAAGLTTYMFTSNLLNVSQMMFTKNVLIDKEKIERELVANQKKPKKKGGFGEKIAAAMKEQQKLQAEKEAGKKRGRKK